MSLVPVSGTGRGHLWIHTLVSLPGGNGKKAWGRKRLLHLLPPEPRPHPHFHLGALSTPLTNDDEWGLPDPGRTLVPEHQGRRVIGLCRQSLQIAPALSPPASAGSQAGDPCR